MIEAIDIWDRELFSFLNSFHSPFWDEFMYYLSEKWTWVPLYVLVLYFVWKQLSLRQLFVFSVAVALLILCTDQLTSGLLKPWAQRYRPCQEGADLGIMVHLVRGHCGGLYGFASSHAANFFGLATFLARFFEKRWVSGLALTLACLTAYSRIYLGVHYPGDVLVGALIGVTVGLGVFILYKYTNQRFLAEK